MLTHLKIIMIFVLERKTRLVLRKCFQTKDLYALLHFPGQYAMIGNLLKYFLNFIDLFLFFFIIRMSFITFPYC